VMTIQELHKRVWAIVSVSVMLSLQFQLPLFQAFPLPELLIILGRGQKLYFSLLNSVI